MPKKKASLNVVSSLIRNPVDNRMFMFLGTSGVNWISEDCGNEVYVMETGRKLSNFMFHPFERNWLLASSWTECSKDYNDGNCELKNQLFYSQNLGENWKFLANYVVQFSW